MQKLMKNPLTFAVAMSIAATAQILWLVARR